MFERNFFLDLLTDFLDFKTVKNKDGLFEVLSSDTSVLTCMLHGFELQCVAVVESEVAAGWHTYETAGLQGCMQVSCIIISCRSQPSTFCQGCTRDVQGIVFVCSPKRGKRCWEILHQARSRAPVDAHGNPIESPSLIKKTETEQQSRDRSKTKAPEKTFTFEPSS